jgi:hypothetical protein
MKDRANFPTFPQLWIGGQLVGGLDIVTELRDAGELAALLPPKGTADVTGEGGVSQPQQPAPASASTAAAADNTSAPSGITGPLTLPDSSVLLPEVAEKLQAVVKRARVMLFMKVRW